MKFWRDGWRRLVFSTENKSFYQLPGVSIQTLNINNKQPIKRRSVVKRPSSKTNYFAGEI
jgi:hypothetical protein